jgi:hypothetical protein
MKALLKITLGLFLLGSPALAEGPPESKVSYEEAEKRINQIDSITQNIPDEYAAWIDKDVRQCRETHAHNVMELWVSCLENLSSNLNMSNNNKILTIRIYLILDSMFGPSHALDKVNSKLVIQKLEKDMGMTWEETGKLMRQWEDEALASEDERERYFAKRYKPYFD